MFQRPVKSVLMTFMKCFKDFLKHSKHFGSNEGAQQSALFSKMLSAVGHTGPAESSEPNKHNHHHHNNNNSNNKSDSSAEITEISDNPTATPSSNVELFLRGAATSSSLELAIRTTSSNVPSQNDVPLASSPYCDAMVARSHSTTSAPVSDIKALAASDTGLEL